MLFIYYSSFNFSPCFVVDLSLLAIYLLSVCGLSCGCVLFVAFFLFTFCLFLPNVCCLVKPRQEILNNAKTDFLFSALIGGSGMGKID